MTRPAIRHRRGAAALTALMIGCVAALSAPSPAFADTDPEQPYEGIEGNFTGGDVTDPSLEQPMDDQTTLKTQLSQEWYAVNFEGADPSKLAQLEADYLAQYGGSGHDDPGGMRIAAAPTSRLLPLTQYGQKTGYYCGPASGYMIIRMLHGSGFTSRYQKGKALSQDNLANASHMNTASAKTTSWTSKKWVTGVNRWRGTNWYVQVAKPSSKLLVSVFTHSVGGNGMPVAADTVEFAGGTHYNGHPTSKTIGHWIVGFGYTQSGQVAHWADPATTVWSATKPTFSYNTSTFASRFLQSNGIAY